ncbi:hypothetical protein ABPG74_006069 [Tetrahymena malaccensis]
MQKSSSPNWVPVILVLIIIGTNYYFQQFIFIQQMFELEYAVAGLFVTIFLNVNVFFMMANYYQCICTPPGSVSPDINELYPNLEQIKERSAKEQKIKILLRKEKKQKKKTGNNNLQNHENTIDIELSNQKEQLKNDIMNFDIIRSIQQVSYCIKCDRIKPPRTHHCKECNRCVQRMDHHCPWVANCVGIQNHKYFILFLLHATLSVGTCCVNITADYIFNDGAIKHSLNKANKLCITVNQVMTFGLVMCIGFLFVFQVIRLLKNQTTVEYHIEEINERNPFDKGTVSNISEILGENKIFWFCPINPFTRIKKNSLQYSTFDQENRDQENQQNDLYQ